MKVSNFWIGLILVGGLIDYALQRLFSLPDWILPTLWSGPLFAILVYDIFKYVNTKRKEIRLSLKKDILWAIAGALLVLGIFLYRHYALPKWILPVVAIVVFLIKLVYDAKIYFKEKNKERRSIVEQDGAFLVVLTLIFTVSLAQ